MTATKKKTEKCQTMFLAFGICIFITVIYLLSNQKSVNKTAKLLNKNKENIKIAVNQRPNFILILTDDQDSVLGSANEMKNVDKYIKNIGIEFRNSFVVSPLCCPSRSSLFSGQYVHNHRAFNNSIDGGCSSKIWQKGPERKSFVNALHQSGYQTFFAGKYLNHYGDKVAGGLSHVPPGWDWWIGLQGNSKYFNYNISVNGTPEHHGYDPSTDYFTNVIKRRALEFLDTVLPLTKPFFVMLSTPACHAPFDAESKYDTNFTNWKTPRTENFNIVNDHSKHWLLRLGEQPLNQEIIEKLDDIYRKRLRTLLTVDEMVKEVMESVSNKGLLNSTYVIFTSDNGFHLGQFSLPLDKREPYEFDIRVPFYISGPDIVKDVVDYSVTNIDIAPTILDLAGVPVPRYFDGESLKSLIQNNVEVSNVKVVEKSVDYYTTDTQNQSTDLKQRSVRKTVLVEHSGEGHYINYGCETLGQDLYGCDPNFACKCSDSRNNTYSCLRHVNLDEDFLYCLWKDDELFEEMYDLKVDFNQLHNIVKDLSPERHKKLQYILKNLSKCRGIHCRKLLKFVF